MFGQNLPATSLARQLLTRATAALMRIDLDVPQNVNPSVADNFASFSNTTGALKDSGKGLASLTYALQYGATSFNPVDATTYYVGTSVIPAQTTGGTIVIPIPQTGTVTYVDLVLTSGAVGSSETFSAYFRKNNTDDTLISSSVAITASNNRFANSSLSIAVTAGDYFEIKVIAPTWATNPTAVRIYGTVLVKV